MKKINKEKVLKNAGLLKEEEFSLSIDLPKPIHDLYQIFKKHGKKLYLVGGAVRDALMGHKPKDFDVATDLPSEDVMKLLQLEKIKAYPKGASFGVVSAIIDGEEMEIATFRKEDYTGGDGRRPTSITYSDIHSDANRRDLTMNALYYDIGAQKVIDLVGGLEDIRNKKIRTVGNPHVQFDQDKLRVMRAVRFANKYGTSLDKETMEAIHHFNQLPGVSDERIVEEILKGLKAALKPESFMADLYKFGLLNRIFAGSEINTKFISGLREFHLVFAQLLVNNPIQTASKTMKNLLGGKDEFMFNGKDIDAVVFLLVLAQRFKMFDKLVFDPSIDYKWLYDLLKARKLVLESGRINSKIIMEWAEIAGLNVDLIVHFIQFQPPFRAKDFPGLQGAELGKKIDISNAQAFVEKI